MTAQKPENRVCLASPTLSRRLPRNLRPPLRRHLLRARRAALGPQRLSGRIFPSSSGASDRSISPVAIFAPMIVAPITSPGRFPPFGPSGMRGAFHQRPDQSQECLVLWSVPILAEERCEFDIRALSARRGVRTVRDKHFVGLVITDEMPAITVGAVIQLSHMMRHTFLHCMPTANA
jgi:hypothetical protein